MNIYIFIYKALIRLTNIFDINIEYVSHNITVIILINKIKQVINT